MRLVYLAGPYRSNRGEHGVFANILKAREAAIELWRLGYAVLCPHLNTFLMGGALNETEDIWLEGDLEMLQRCDVLVVLPGWEQSQGSQAEIEQARKAGLEIYYWPELPPN